MRQGPIARLARAGFVLALVAAPIAVATAAFADDPSVQSTATVGNGTELREQWAIGDNTLITLTADIDLGDDTDLCLDGEPLRSDSNSSNSVTIDGQGLYGITQTCDDQRVLHDENVGETVTLTGLTHFTGGEAEGHGGGLRNGGPVNVVDSTINDNRANNECNFAASGDAQEQIIICDDGDGGGIFAGPEGLIPLADPNYDVSVTNSIVQDNWAADDGGGVYSAGALTVTGSQFNGNTAAATTVSQGRGGGAYADDSVSVVDSSFTDNEVQCGVFEIFANDPCGAAADGGGFFTFGSATVSGSTFTSNSAWDSGGGFFAADADVSNSTFTGNTAGGTSPLAAGFSASELPEPLAGAVAAADSEDGSQYCDCVGGGFAVGLVFQDTSVPEAGAQVVNSTFVANLATCNIYCWGSGGGFFSAGGASVSGSTFGDPSDEEAGNAVGCFFSCGASGGGAYVGRGADVDTSAFHANSGGCIESCDAVGGGLFSGGGLLSSIDGLTEKLSDGAQAALAGDGSLKVVQTTFAGNTAGCAFGACGGSGGGLYGSRSTTVDVTASTFNDNESFWDGGAISVNGGISFNLVCDACGTAVTITNSTVTGNTSGWPAAISVPGDDDTLTLVNDTIDSNSIEERELDCVATVCSESEAKAQQCQCLAANVSAFNLTSFGTDITHPILADTAEPVATFDDIENCWYENSTSEGFNFSDDDSCNFDDSTDNVADGNDPMLGALADNGGPTQTMLPQPGSPLIDAIQPVSECQVDVDQRGVTRPQIKGCDTGAVEVQGASLQVTKVVTGTDGIAVPSSGYSFQVSCTDGSAATLTVADATNGGSSDVLSDILPGSTCTVVEDAIVYTNPLVTTQPAVSYDPATGSPLAEGEASVVTVTNNYEGINLLGVVVNITPRFTG